ncbi:Outer membrane protein assembly factor BamB precursor [Pirellulimonas nuda]|uniref:Outer membrane protein assembly factor BamB n=1 Tax=Pirellulimonas nuda TaxID=2528009 RepID=A0A518D6E8_9BACT|nr:PQQ-binding-like beta-propeller repeat protein [Pirellulimonas nuda]QDU87058.1 Outer membrane protein assembly factor BamB precursor [Pirellulimonas nuda]
MPARLGGLILALAAAQPAFTQQPADGRGASDAPTSLSTRATGSDWPDFLGPHRDGKSAETGLALGFSGEGPPIVWRCDLGQSYAAPTVALGRLLHFGRHGDQARLTCRNAETGDELWTIEHPTDFTDMLGYNNGPRASPVVDGGRAYTMSADGVLQCVTLADGKLVWRIDTTEKFGVVKNFFGVGGTPVVWGELLIANIGGSPAGSPSDVYAASGRVEGNGTGIVAFNKRTGEVVWQATDELASYSSPIIHQHAGQTWLLALARGGLVGLNPADGAVRFEFAWRSRKLESVNASTPVAAGDRVFISEAYEPGGAVLRLTDAQPEVVWSDGERRRDKSMELHWNTPVLLDGYLYGSSGQHAGQAELRCVEFATGRVAWGEPGLGRASLLLADGKLICLSEDGTLRLLKATPDAYTQLAEWTPRSADGEPLLGYPAWAAPVLSHGLLYVRGADRLLCLDVSGGRTLKNN